MGQTPTTVVETPMFVRKAALLKVDAPTREGLLEREEAMKRPAAARRKAPGKPTVGQEIIASLNEAISWAKGEDVPVRITTVHVRTVDVREVRRKLKLSQSQFAARFGFAPASVRNWEQGRTRPDGPARILLAVIAKHPEAVEDALRAVAA